MDILTQIYQKIESFGLHRYGWLFAAAVLLIPAIVSGNMVQHYLTLLLRRQEPWRRLIKPLIGNLVLALLCGGIIVVAIMQYS